MDPWPVNDPFVEIQTDAQLIDLHNWATLTGFTYAVPARLIVRFEYDESEGTESPNRLVYIDLVFEEAERLSLRQADVEERYEPDRLSDIVYRPVELGFGEVEITAMDGRQLKLFARSVSLKRSTM